MHDGNTLDRAFAERQYNARGNDHAVSGGVRSCHYKTCRLGPGLPSKEVVEGLRPNLLVYRDEDGQELFDVPDAPQPDSDTPAPPRFLPKYDNVLASHANRTRIIADEHRKLVMMKNGMKATFLLDGFVCGTWRIVPERGSATLVVEPFGKLTLEEKTH